MADILDKDLKTTVLKMLKKTKEVEKSQENDTWTKWRYQWKVESLKRNPGAEKYSNWNEKFMCGFQRLILTGIRISQWSWKEDHENYWV